jgi:prepilin-type N-terminal cleavage/methylation domain-containing protein
MVPVVYNINNLFKYKKMKKGFSLLEIIISLVILGLTLLGIFSVFIAGRRYTERSKRKLVSLNIARQVVEKIKEDVRQDTWNTGSNKLSVGTQNVSSIYSAPANFNDWSGTVECVVGGVGSTGLRQATIKVKWTEPSE